MIDYMISTAHNFGLLLSLKIHDFNNLYSDAHCPISISINSSHEARDSDSRKNNQTEPPQVRLWNNDKKESFCLNLDYGEILKITSVLDVMTQGGPVTLESINNIVCQIETLFLSAARNSFGYKGKIKITNTTNKNKKKWFNSECRSERNSYHIARKKIQ